MAPSPKHKKIDLVSFDILVDGSQIPGTYVVKEITVERALNKIPIAKVVIIDGDPSKENFEISESDDFKPGKTIKINAGYHQENETIFEGVIINQKAKISGESMSAITINAQDKASKMVGERHNKYFLDKKDSDVIEEVISQNGVSANVEASTLQHDELIQYNVCDWDFMITRAEFAGMVVNVVDGEVRVNKPKATEGPVLTLLNGTSILKSDFDMNAGAQYKSVKAKGWDFSTQAVLEATAKEPTVNSQGDLDGPSLANEVHGDEVVIQSTVPLTQEYLQAWADATLLKARLARIQGRVLFYGSSLVLPDTTVEIKGMGSKFNGNAYVSGVSHKISDGSWVTECQIGLTEKFYSETQKDMHTQPAGGLIPPVGGLQIGTVQKIDSDPHGEYRVLVDVPMIAASGDGVWARMASFYKTNEAGDFWYPEIGDEVVLGFLNQDPRYPVILGSVYGKSHVPAYEPDAENTYKAIVTNSKMKIEFEDVKRIITIWTPNENYMEFSDDEGTITIEDENKNKMVMSSAGIEFYTPKDFILKADANIKMEAGQNFEMKATSDMSLQAMNISNAADVGFSAEGTTAELKGSASTTIKGGMVQIN